MRVFLCGKGKAAGAILGRLVDLNQDVAIFTHPGDGLFVQAAHLGKPKTIQSVNETAYWPWKPDMIISCGYLYIVTPDILEMVGGRAINCHYSLLPKHRGRSPVPWAIFDGDERTGITWHWIDEGIDTGRVLTWAATHIEHDETQATLFDKLHVLAASYFEVAWSMATRGETGSEQQGETSRHYSGPPCGGEIDPSWPDDKVERFIRAMTYPPYPYARMNGREVRTMDGYRGLRDGG